MSIKRAIPTANEYLKKSQRLDQFSKHWTFHVAIENQSYTHAMSISKGIPTANEYLKKISDWAVL